MPLTRIADVYSTVLSMTFTLQFFSFSIEVYTTNSVIALRCRRMLQVESEYITWY